MKKTRKVLTLKPLHYRRSTPVGRLRRNAQKILRHAELVGARIGSWKTDCPELATVDEGAKAAKKIASTMDSVLEQLEATGWEPPPKATSTSYEPGDRVAVAVQHLDKYREALAGLLKEDPDMLEDLIVDKVLPTGEIVLRRGKRIVVPMAPKSHLVPREPDNDGEE